MASSTADAIQGALNVVADPCLRDVAGLLYRLHELEAAGKPADTTPVQPTLGIGLCKAVKPIKAAIYLRENPWIAAIGVAAFLGVFVGIGYRIGQRKASS